MSEIDERIICPHCGRRITPRLSFLHGEPYRTWCPYCKGRLDDDDGILPGVLLLVLIATALYYWIE